MFVDKVIKNFNLIFKAVNHDWTGPQWHAFLKGATLEQAINHDWTEDQVESIDKGNSIEEAMEYYPDGPVFLRFNNGAELAEALQKAVEQMNSENHQDNTQEFAGEESQAAAHHEL